MDEAGFDGAYGTELLLEIVAELIEFSGVLAGEDLCLGVEAEFERVAGRGGFPLE